MPAATPSLVIDNPTAPAPATVGPVATSGPRLPLSLPRWLVDGAVMAVAGLLYTGFVGFNVHHHGWQLHTVAAAAGAPTVLALWRRHRHPLPVLAVTCAAALLAPPPAVVPVLVALYTAAQRLPVRQALLAWAPATACMIAGLTVAQGVQLQPLLPAATSTGMATALGLYVGVRRNYLIRLHERGLFARALAAFLPPEVAELVRTSPAALSLQGEVEATILFSDIRGFSTLAERTPPRQVAQVVGRHLAAMAEVVRSHGGLLDKFTGDAVMAVFGAPRPIPDHASRAVACAIAMQRRQAQLNAAAESAGLPCTDIGIGINTGSVIAGLVGGAGRLDYTVLGDAVNVAQRLQSLAKAGEILASAATVALGARPTAEPAGTRLLRGRQQPVTVYRLAWAEPTTQATRDRPKKHKAL
jgi:class 3 adenylate cyclase